MCVTLHASLSSTLPPWEDVVNQNLEPEVQYDVGVPGNLTKKSQVSKTKTVLTTPVKDTNMHATSEICEYTCILSINHFTANKLYY